MDYSKEIPRILDQKGRLRVANQILGVLKTELKNLHTLTCLDIGCSSGVITNFLAGHFKNIDGIDVDKRAIKIAKTAYKKKNLKFSLIGSQDLKFKDSSFNVIICNQVYNFVEDPKKLMSEIYRVLKPGGVCFFGARNKFAFIEPQYRLPLLSWFPSNFARIYLRLTTSNKNFIGENYMSYWQLRKLVKDFQVNDLTLEIVKNPKKFGFKNLKSYPIITRFLPKLILPLIPNYIWILKKI